MALAADLENLFSYHPPKPGQNEKYEAIRAKALEFAKMIEELAPPSRERSEAITQLQSSVMWANASIACNTLPDLTQQQAIDIANALPTVELVTILAASESE